MNILVLSSFLHPRGGDTTCMFLQVRELAERGHHLVPFAMRHPDNFPSSYETFFPPWLDFSRPADAAAALWNPAAARGLEALLEQVPVDVAHIHHLHRHLSPSVLEPLAKRNIPVVWTVHDYELICPNGLLYTEGAYCDRCKGHTYQEAVRHRCKRGDLLQSLAVAAEKELHRRRHILDRVDRLICPSRFLLERLLEFGVPSEKLLHVPNPIALPEQVRPLERRNWLYAGRLTPEKGVEDLCEAAKQLPDVPLTICGDGPERERLQRRAPPWVRWLGQVSTEEVGRRLEESTIVVVPSRWPENLPYAVVEAQARGRPVVATAVGGIPELIVDEESGILVKPGRPDQIAAAVRNLWEDLPKARRIGEVARQRLREGHAPRSFATKMETLYGSLLDARAVPRPASPV